MLSYTDSAWNIESIVSLVASCTFPLMKEYILSMVVMGVARWEASACERVSWMVLRRWGAWMERIVESKLD